jgi:putative acetyltransferase
MKLIRTNSDNPDFQSLVVFLDRDLKIRDGDEHEFYAQFNKTDSIKNVVVAYFEDEAVGCGAFKSYSENTAEIKRMYVKPEFRGRRIAQQILTELEEWASESGFVTCVLETGFNQPEAIQLYQRCGYEKIANYGQYEGIENSLCMQKIIHLPNKS